MTGTKIWIAANQGEVGGGEVMLHHIATALRELGRHVAVVAPAEPAEVAERMEADGFDVARIAGNGRLAYMRGLRHWHRDHRRDVLWCNGLLPAAALAGRARRIVHLHQVPEKPQLRAFAAVAKFRALAVLGPSDFIATKIPGVRVLSNWVAGPRLPRGPRAGAKGEPFRVGFLGRLTEDKGILTLLEAAALLRTSAPETYAFRIAGESLFVSGVEAERVASALHSAEADVAVLGWQDTDTFLAGVDALVVPSQVPESFGLVAAEAMAAGVPVIVSDAGALPEVVGPEHPWTFPQKDAEALAAAIEDALAADRQPIADAQYRRWADLWSPAAGRRAVSRLLEDLDV